MIMVATSVSRLQLSRSGTANSTDKNNRRAALTGRGLSYVSPDNGVVDRVVELSNGDYEVHNIGVNWPHHIFVNQDFQVIGADD
jgi:hypothetical protein